MKGPIGQLQLGFGKSIYNFEEVQPAPPTDQFPVNVVNPQNMDIIMYDTPSQKWINKSRIILTDGGNF